MSQPRPEITHLFSSFGFRVFSFPLLFCHLDYGLASDFPLFLQVSFGGGEVQAASTDLLKDFEQEGVDRTELCLRLLGKVYNFPSTIRLFYLRVFLSSTNSSTF